MIVYIARPIDFADADDSLRAEGVASLVRTWAVNHGHAAYDPAQAWAASCAPNTHHTAEALCEVNNLALQLADLVVAIVHPGMHSIGVPAEIALAKHLARTVALVNLDPHRFAGYQLQYWLNSSPTLNRPTQSGEVYGFLDEVARGVDAA